MSFKALSAVRNDKLMDRMEIGGVPMAVLYMRAEIELAIREEKSERIALVWTSGHTLML